MDVVDVPGNKIKEDPAALFPDLITRASKFYGKGSHTSLWDVSQAALVQITVSGVPNTLNLCVVF